MLCLIPSLQLTGKGDSVRGFISACEYVVCGNFSMKAPVKYRESGSSEPDRNSLLRLAEREHQFLFDFTLWRLDRDNKRHGAPAAYNM